MASARSSYSIFVLVGEFKLFGPEPGMWPVAQMEAVRCRYNCNVESPGKQSRVTIQQVRRWSSDGQCLAMLTCYDATTAAWLWRGGVKLLLVGDTAARFILGHDSTLPVGMDFMVAITAAVRRGAPAAFIMADMPFGSYQCGDDLAVGNAMRFLTEGAADAVKMELDVTFAPLVKRMTSAGIPVVAHLGSRPQQKRLAGPSSRRVYRSNAQVAQTVDTACQMVDSGAVMILLEAVPSEVSTGVVNAVAGSGPDDKPVLVIGCGAGPACHGHVVVLHDLLGLTAWQPPFASPLLDLGAQIERAAKKWVDLVASGRYLAEGHPYKLQP